LEFTPERKTAMTSSSAIEDPAYRVKTACYVNCKLYDEGAVITTKDWPNLSKLEPANEGGKRLAAWASKHQFDFGKPVTPHSDLAGGVYLPAVLPRQFPPLSNAEKGSWLPSPVPPDQVTKKMPRYTTSGGLIGKVTVAAGEVFAYLGWPEAWFRPANPAAEMVSEYFAANRNNPAILPAPWCEYRLDLCLPTLPEKKNAAEVERQARIALRQELKAMGYQVVG
jgi:hypothetical protein